MPGFAPCSGHEGSSRSTLPVPVLLLATVSSIVVGLGDCEPEGAVTSTPSLRGTGRLPGRPRAGLVHL
jgi:hypothetical protein